MPRLIDRQLQRELLAEAHENPRRRAHRNLHQRYDEPVQRVCIGLIDGSYVRPHAHPQPHQWELILGLRGRTGLVIFDSQGRIIERHVLSGTDAVNGIELPPGTWHTLFPLDPEVLILEIKQGPYDPANAARFAPWAPAEQSEQAPRFLHWVAEAGNGSTFS